jgi:hypothetical protein
MHKDGPATSDGLWTAQQTAEFLACSMQHVLRLAVTGALPAISLAPLGSKKQMWRFDPRAVRAWVKARQNGRSGSHPLRRW